MNVTVEIDKAGRIVVPKQLRDALHLTPGTRLKVERSGDSLLFGPMATHARLVIENGTPLIFAADEENPSVVTNEMVTAVIAAGRDAHEQGILDTNSEAAQ